MVERDGLTLNTVIEPRWIIFTFAPMTVKVLRDVVGAVAHSQDQDLFTAPFRAADDSRASA